MLAFTVVFGTVGFMVVEGWSLLDAFYMSLITITTIGYREIQPLSDGGRLLNSAVILLGVGSFSYTITQLMHSLVQRELLDFFRSRAMTKDLEKLNDHFIVCGAGRLGTRIISHLEAGGSDFVVIDSDEAAARALGEMGVRFIHGDATEEATMQAAGVTRAQGLVTAIGSDAENVYITLTARELNPSLVVVARANSSEAEPRLKRAGASRVVSPERIGSRQMADALLRPAVIDFFDDVMKTTELRVNMEDLVVEPGSQLDGVQLAQANLPQSLGVNVVMVRRADGTTEHRPGGDFVLEGGDHIVVISDQASLERLHALCR